MGFRSRVREYVRSLTARRRSRSQGVVRILATPVPPPSTTPGTALSAISEESSHLRTLESERFTPSPRIIIPSHELTTRIAPSFDADALINPSPSPDTELPPSREIQNHRAANLDRTPNPDLDIINRDANNQSQPSNPRRQASQHHDTSESAPGTASNPYLSNDQFTPLGPSKYFIIPAGRDDYLIRILHYVRLDDVNRNAVNPAEIKILAPNAYYSPKVGHCVLIQCGHEQWIASVVMKISAEQGGSGGVLEGLVGANLNVGENPRDSRLFEENMVFNSPQPLQPNASVSDLGSLSDFRGIGLLSTPAAIRNVISNRLPEPGGQSRSSSFDRATTQEPGPAVASVDSRAPPHNHVDTSVQTRKNSIEHKETSNLQHPHSTEAIQEIQRTREQISTQFEVEGPKQPLNTTIIHERRRSFQQHQFIQTEAELGNSELTDSSMSGTRELVGFGTPYVPAPGETASGWNTPHPLPRTPPPREPNPPLQRQRSFSQGTNTNTQPQAYIDHSSTESLSAPIPEHSNNEPPERPKKQPRPTYVPMPSYLQMPPMPPANSPMAVVYPPGYTSQHFSPPFVTQHQLPPHYRASTAAAAPWVWVYPEAPPAAATTQASRRNTRFLDRAGVQWVWGQDGGEGEGDDDDDEDEGVEEEMSEIPIVPASENVPFPSGTQTHPASALRATSRFGGNQNQRTRRHSNTIPLPSPGQSPSDKNSDSDVSP